MSGPKNPHQTLNNERQATISVHAQLEASMVLVNELVKVHMIDHCELRDNDLQMLLHWRNLIIEAMVFGDGLVKNITPQLTLAKGKFTGKEA